MLPPTCHLLHYAEEPQPPSNLFSPVGLVRSVAVFRSIPETAGSSSPLLKLKGGDTAIFETRKYVGV